MNNNYDMMHMIQHAKRILFGLKPVLTSNAWETCKNRLDIIKATADKTSSVWDMFLFSADLVWNIVVMWKKQILKQSNNQILHCYDQRESTRSGRRLERLLSPLVRQFVPQARLVSNPNQPYFHFWPPWPPDCPCQDYNGSIQILCFHWPLPLEWTSSFYSLLHSLWECFFLLSHLKTCSFSCGLSQW